MACLSLQTCVRAEGTQGELTAATYLKTGLERLSYMAGWPGVTLPNGTKSVNKVIADPGTSDKYTFLTSGHVETRSSSPGANDNAS